MIITLFPAVCAVISLAVLLVVLVRVKGYAPSKIPLRTDLVINIEAGLRAEISGLAERIADLESRSREDVSGGVVRAGVNLSKRTQALRQYRLGQGPDNIAKSLDMTKAEVVLLLKVQQIVSR